MRGRLRHAFWQVCYMVPLPPVPGAALWRFLDHLEAKRCPLARVSAPGQFQLQGSRAVGLTYTLQTSTNLVDWVDRINVVAGAGGLLECLMAMDPNAPACFYRLRWP